jgi:DNA-binding NarL/FixJ family response regulator
MNHSELHSSRAEEAVLLSPRQKQITDLLLQGCSNLEIAELLKMKQRTVKAHFNRLFLRFGITNGIRRVKLATHLYRSQLILEENAVDPVTNEREL